MLDREALRIRLIDNRLSRIAAELSDLAAPCITIQTELSSDKSIPIGFSKFGGRPDVSADFDWPTWKEKPLSFLAQINLSAFANNPVSVALPSAGLLSFFYAADQFTWGFDPEDRGSWGVYLFDQIDLQRRETPEALPDEVDFRPCDLSFGEGVTLPGCETPQIEELQLTDEERDAYYDSCANESAGGHHLLGHPQEIQGAMQLECQLASNGINVGSSEGYGDPRARELEGGASDWLLLLQIDSDDNPEWMWGDVGMLYFWITKSDLKLRRFENVWMVLQCC